MVTARTIGVAIALLLIPLGASAQGGDAARARKLFTEGTEAIRTGQFAQARDSLRQSLSLHPRVGTAFNLATAYRGTGELRSAIDVLDRLIAREYGSVTGKQRRAAKAVRNELSRQLVTLRLALERPDAATVFVDGASLGDLSAAEPRDMLIDPGARRLRIAAPGYIAHAETLTVYAGDRRTVKAKLKSETATLVLTTSNPKHWVEIVGVEKKTHTLTSKLAPGSYDVRVYSGRRSHRRTVDLGPGSSTRVDLDLPPVPLRKRPWFWVGIGVAAVGASVGGYYLIRPGTNPVRESDDVGGVIVALH